MPLGNAIQPRPLSMANVVAAFVVAVFAALNLSNFSIIWFPSMYGEFGFSTGGPIAGTTVTTVVPGSPAATAGIKLGDLVDRPARLRDRLIVAGVTVPRPDERMTVTIVRAGKRHMLSLQARSLAPLSLISRVGSFLLLVVLVIFVATGLVLVLLRPSKMTWGFYLFAFAIIIATGPCDCWGYVSEKIPAVWSVALTIIPQGVLTSFGIVGFLVFCLRFSANAQAGWRRSIDNLAPFMACALAAVAATRDISYVEFAPRITDSLTHIFDTTAFAIAAAAVAAFLITYFTARGLERHRIKWVVLGLMCACIPIAAVTLYFEGLFNPPDWVFSVLNLLYVPLPLAIAYAVLRHRVIDIRIVLSRSLVFGVIAAIVVLVVIGLGWLFSARLPTSRFEVAIIAGAAIFVGFALNAARQRVGKAIDILFFRRWHQTQEQVDTIGDALRRATSTPDLYEPLTAGIARAFFLASAALFERVEDGGFVRVAAYAWPVGTLWNILLDDPIVLRANKSPKAADIDTFQWQERGVPAGVARPTIMIPVAFGRRVPAILLYGAHENGTSLDADEIRAIRRLCADAGLVYSRSLSSDWEKTAFVTAPLGVP
ncbi:MAG: hypothetical protein M3007_04870 [Candidatus Eremiobacteraeota bacterium]|nr:hypothetical protein [Candidatus Eremiobacteraeota bacterium]